MTRANLGSCYRRDGSKVGVSYSEWYEIKALNWNSNTGDAFALVYGVETERTMKRTMKKSGCCARNSARLRADDSSSRLLSGSSKETLEAVRRRAMRSLSTVAAAHPNESNFIERRRDSIGRGIDSSCRQTSVTRNSRNGLSLYVGHQAFFSFFLAIISMEVAVPGPSTSYPLQFEMYGRSPRSRTTRNFRFHKAGSPMPIA